MSKITKIYKNRQNRVFWHFQEQVLLLISGQIEWQNKAGHVSNPNK